MPSSPDRDKAALDLEWAELLHAVAGKASGPAGAVLVRALEPAETVADATERARLTRSALELLAEGTPLPALAVPNVNEVVERLERDAAATGPEFRDLARVLDGARVLRTFLVPHSARHGALAKALAVAPSLDKLLAEIRGAIDEGGEVMDRASPELARSRRKVADARREVQSRLSALMNQYADVLRDKFYTERDGRYVLPVRADAQFRFDGIVLGSSASGGTLYVEPREITELGNKRHVAEAEVEREVARILGAISISARAEVEAIRTADLALTHADALLAMSRWGAEHDAVVITPTDGRELDLRTMRHPLLSSEGMEVVPSDVRLEGGRCLVISGPNAGGKTVALKCLGLAAWMARSGLPIPLDGASRIGWFEHVLTDIGDEQSLARSLSTFSAHAARLASYIESAGRRTLILLDEVAAGTDPDEGAALAAAVLERLVDNGAAVAVTTHYERLKQLAVRDDRFENASVGFDFEAMRPTFRLTLGIPGASSALVVAERFGIPRTVIDRAEKLLPEENLRRDRLLAEIEVDRTRAAAERRAAEADAAEQAGLTRKLEAEVLHARERERARLVRESSELSARVREAREELRKATDRARNLEGGKEELRAIERSLNAAAREASVGGPIEAALRPASAASQAAPGSLSPGDRVYVTKLRAHAEVLEAPSKGQVRVTAGAMKLTVRLDELGPVPGGTKPAEKKKARPAPLPAARDAAPVRTSSNTCDVRGMRVDEAKGAVESLLDQLLREGEPAGFVLHGHGTGALKAALREFLTGHRFVTKARPAEEEDGGDAFTVFWTAG